MKGNRRFTLAKVTRKFFFFELVREFLPEFRIHWGTNFNQMIFLKSLDFWSRIWDSPGCFFWFVLGTALQVFSNLFSQVLPQVYSDIPSWCPEGFSKISCWESSKSFSGISTGVLGSFTYLVSTGRVSSNLSVIRLELLQEFFL